MKSRKLYLKWKRNIWNETLRIKNIDCDENMPSNDEANRMIEDALMSNKPFCLLRPGNVEYSFAAMWDEHILFRSNKYRESGMFRILDRDYQKAQKWVDIFESDLKEADIFSLFAHKQYMEHYLLEAYADTEKLIWLWQLETHLNAEKPWTQRLRGKKVLVISPFVETMREQYRRRQLVWAGKEVLPDMDIKFLQSVWYLSNTENDGFEDWFAALYYLQEKARKIDFDVALIGCGPFSTFLAAQFKREGKQAIQYGGALQLLFGIRGKRWDNNSFYEEFYNEYWVRLEQKQAPKGKEWLDSGCYW